MVEHRKKLSPIQLKSLLAATSKFAKAEATYKEALTYKEEITSLIFDAHGIQTGTQARFDQETDELVIYIDGE